MLNRIKDFLCHPSRIGLYHKDKGIVVAAYLIVMMLLTTLVAGLSTLNSSFFTSSDSKQIYDTVLSCDCDYDLEFNNKVLSGSSYSVTSEDFDAVFLGDGAIPKSGDKMTMHFHAEKINIYLGNMLVNEFGYNEARFDDFSFRDLQNKDLAARLDFENLVMSALKSVDRFYLNIDLFSGVLSIILSYVFLVIIVAAFSYMTKPDLSLGIRMRICIYGSLIYFLLIIFRLCFNSQLFELAAYIVPVFYVNTAFSRIIRVRIKKD